MEYIETAMSIIEGVINYEGIDEKMEKLKRKLKHLKSREEDVTEELKHAEGLSLKKPRKVVENWLENVGHIKNQIEQMEQQIQERRWFSHLPLERKMGMLTEQAAELDQQGQFPEGLTLEAHGNKNIKLITAKLIGQTFQQHKDVIWECLRSNNVSKIGIYGMGGVGKTTLLIDIHNEILDHPNFSVSWVTASQDFRIHKLQNDIAKTIRLELENDDDERKRAAQLAWHLRNMNNFVLILDDVWQHLPLDRVGIPTGGNGCKLILTSRSLEVCRKIGCEEHIKVEPLSEKDAWELFTEKLGHETLSHEIEPIAKLLAKKCSGLPLGIITMAGCMREVEDISEWSDALGKMNESVAEHDDDMSTEVFQVLKYSYDRLKDPKVKQCFLYCSLFPEDFEIERETLIEYSIDERLVDGMRSRQAKLNKGLAILNKLENVCLLEVIMKANGKKYVKMHDLVRSMAIKIAKVNSPILVKAGEQLIGQTFQQHKDVIWKWLRSDHVSKIGIYGMGGVGKTTLVTHIHNELRNNRPNSRVSWVTVSQNFNILKLQNDIAKTIELDIENEDDKMKRAAKLLQRLRNMNNFVLILDDVWKDFTIDELGIPSRGNGFKLILTSRSLEVCRRIGCDEYTKVEPLSKYDAWELFTEIFGHGRALSPEIESIARSLTEKCSGLPLAIKTVAGSMRGVKDISEWRDALEKLKERVAEHDDDIGIEVLQVLRYSYDHLKDPKVQQCLLYCSLFPEDYENDRETLIELFIDEAFVDGLRSRQAELDRGHTVLNKLENVCLLEAGIGKYSGKRCVKMHDLVRSMAIQIGRDKFQFLVEAGKQLREIPGEEKWPEDLKKVSLMDNRLSHIPSSIPPKCPRLTTLMLNNNFRLEIIPDCFFSHMPQLSVLNLSRTYIENLPASISELVNLTALWLEECEILEYVPSLENLKALRRLNLMGTLIREVPHGLDTLLNLRYLNLEETLIETIPDGILSKLSRLQYLAIDFSLDWPTRKVRGEEIVELSKLETFRGRLYNMDDFNTYVRWREENGGPNNYVLLLTGELAKACVNDVEPPSTSKVVQLSGCKISKSKGGEDSFVLPKDVQLLIVENCNDTASLCDIPSLNNATKLSGCDISCCQGMEHVVCSGCSLPLIQYLDSLDLNGLTELRALIGAERRCASASSNLLQPRMFSSLRKFSIGHCPKIKRLFTRDLLPNLENLVRLEVIVCDNMVEIIGEASDEDEDDENQEAVSTTSSIIHSLPKLTHLRLIRLQKLKRFCTSKIVFDSLKEIVTCECPKLSFNGDRVYATYSSIRTYSVVNSRIGERLSDEELLRRYRGRG